MTKIVKKNPSKPARKSIKEGYGPAMSACSPWQRKYVEARYAHPEMRGWECLIEVGYRGGSQEPDKLRVAARQMAHRMDHNPLVQAAMLEVGATEYRSKLPKVIDALDKIIDDPRQRDRVKVLHGLLDRVGMHQVSEVRATITQVFDREAAIERLATLLERHAVSLPLQRLIPQNIVREGDTVDDGAGQRLD